MILLPPESLIEPCHLLKDTEDALRSIYRLIVFSKAHQSSDLLSRYREATAHLRQVLSFKNAQQEAHSQEEARIYLAHLQESMALIISEISEGRSIGRPVDLFHLFRTIAPEAAEKHPNMYRQTLVQFGPCVPPLPGELDGLVQQLFDVLPTIKHPVMRAAYLHHELIRIHPFVDGNGRVSRMAKNWMLMYDLYPPIIIYAGSDRKAYIQNLQDSFLALASDPETFGPATANFFNQEILRIKASTDFILNRMLKNPTLDFGPYDLSEDPTLP